jgi:RNA polymerase sigma factor (sigma-70 family)
MAISKPFIYHPDLYASNAIRRFATCWAAKTLIKPQEIESLKAYQFCRMKMLSSRTKLLWAERARHISNLVATLNTGLVLNPHFRRRWSAADADTVTSDAWHAMLRAINCFNPWSGWKFSTYASYAIKRSVCRSHTSAYKNRTHQPAEYVDELCTRSVARQCRRDEMSDDMHDRLIHALATIDTHLTQQEVLVINARFLEWKGDVRRLTLENIACATGKSKERIRQIQASALRKLRSVLGVRPLLK